MEKTYYNTLVEAVNYTNRSYRAKYKNANQNDILAYSANILERKICEPVHFWIRAYTRQMSDLRDRVIAIPIDGVKNEILKIVVSYGTYQSFVHNGTSCFGVDLLKDNLTHTEFAQSIVNNVSHGRIREMYDAFDIEKIRKRCLYIFVIAISNPILRERLEMFQTADPSTIHLHDQLDVYYARWGKSENSQPEYNFMKYKEKQITKK